MSQWPQAFLLHDNHMADHFLVKLFLKVIIFKKVTEHLHWLFS